VIVGAGAAGLSFAYYLAHLDSTHEFSCTLIDPDAKTDYDRTWSYWGDHFDFDDLVEREWKRLLVRDGDTTAQACFGGRGYRFVPSDRFYRRCLEVITADSRFSERRSEGADLSWYRADYVVDSVFGPAMQPGASPGDLGPREEPAFRQSFVGWLVEIGAATWDRGELCLMDFDAPSDGTDPVSTRPALEFAYTLPFTDRRALVEFTAVGRAQPSDEYLESRLESYLAAAYGRTGKLLSPAAVGDPAMPPHRRLRPRFYDRVFLEVLAGEPAALPSALTGLFHRNRTERVFRFLAGRSTLLDEGAIIMSLPWGPFLRALWRTLTRNRSRQAGKATGFAERTQA
jgi:hypothetical protein